jgi:hypothetical protein
MRMCFKKRKVNKEKKLTTKDIIIIGTWILWISLLFVYLKAAVIIC